jgi:hypothetical protein
MAPAWSHTASGSSSDYGNSRTVSMTYGRPLMVPLCNLSTLRAPECLHNTTAPSGRPDASERQNIIFYQHSLVLAEILAKIVSLFYDDSLTSEEDWDPRDLLSDDKKLLKAPALIRRIDLGDFQELIKLEASMDKWERELPEWLQFPDLDNVPSGQQLKVDRQRVVLRVRSVLLKHSF